MSTYSTMILSDSPQAYYRMDEASGTTAHDSSGHSYNATVTFATLSQAGAIIGDSDTCMAFTEAGGLTLPTNLQIFTYSAASIEFWYRPLNGAWGHIVAVTDNTQVILYYNGSVVSPAPTSTLFVGSLFDTAGSLVSTGELDEIAIYNYVLAPSRISAHYLAGNPYTFSQFNLGVYKEQQVLVYDGSGNFIDCVRDAPLLSGFKDTLNGVTSPLKVQLPRKFENLDLLGTPNNHGTMQQGYVWKYYLYGAGLPSSGLLRYSGAVDGYEPQIADSGEETIAVTLTPQGAVVADHGITGNPITFTSVDPIGQFNSFFSTIDAVTNQAYCNPLTLDSSNPTSSGVMTSFSYQNQNIKSIFDTIILMLPVNYFYRCNPDNTVTLNQTPLTAQHTLQVGVHCSNPQYSQSWIQTQTAVYFVGNGVSSIVRGTDMGTIGERLYYYNENRASSPAQANVLSQGYLNYYDRPLLRTKIRVPDYRGPSPSVGYDIEGLKCGDSIQLQDDTYNGASTLWDQAKWDTGIWDQSPGPAFNVIGVIASIAYGFFYVDLELGLPQPSLQKAVADVQQAFQDFTML
jgi:hypothetical protein